MRYFRNEKNVLISTCNPDFISPYGYMEIDRNEYERLVADRTNPCCCEPEPTQLDRIEAQVTYTAMMTDTLLEV